MLLKKGIQTGKTEPEKPSKEIREAINMGVPRNHVSSAIKPLLHSRPLSFADRVEQWAHRRRQRRLERRAAKEARKKARCIATA
ncbi:MAG: hypothetical protein PHT40_00570 [Patescibacteria group bacterium]|nr:hypothetical protein [Patescibacteria group bacterium]